MKQTNRLSRAAALFCVLLVSTCTMPAYGCGGAMAVIGAVATVITEITGALDSIEDQVEDRGPTADPAAAKAVLDAVSKARKALLVVQAAAHGAEGVASQDYAQAVNALLDAYEALLELAREFEVLAAPESTRARLGAAPEGVILVPEVPELRSKLMAGSK